MAETCNHLIKYITHVNSTGGISEIDDLPKHAICNCVNRLGDSVKVEYLGFDRELQRTWSGLSVITASHHLELDLSKVWAGLPGATQVLLETINKKLK